MSKQINYSKYQKRVIKFLNDLLTIDTPFSYERTNNNHFKVLISGVPKPLYTGSTPSDCKSINNFMAEVKRELKASKIAPVEEKSTLIKATSVIERAKESNDKLILNAIKLLRPRLQTIKQQEESLVLEEQSVDRINGCRLDVARHSITYALKSRKQGAYIKTKDMKEIEKTIITHLNFMLPTMAYYAELLECKTKNEPLSKQEKTTIHQLIKANVATSPKEKTKPTKDLVNNLMTISNNNRLRQLRGLTNAQALTLIDNINQAMDLNREDDIQSVIDLIREKDLPMDAIISRMESL